MRPVTPRVTFLALPGWSPGRRRTARRPRRGEPSRRVTTLARGALLALISVIALGVLTPSARADGDPGSDVLVYQNLFVPADANISVQEQVRLGNLLTTARQHGFTIRVAVIAHPDDLGAVTALWRKPAAYAQFLGIELSLAYKQRLLIVMPDGFGFNWPGHPSADADRLLAKIPVGHGGNGLATATETAVRTLAAASGVTIPAPAGTAPAGTAATASSAASSGQGAASGGPAASAGSAGMPAPLLLAVVLAAASLVIAAGWLALRRGWRLPYRRREPGQRREVAPADTLVPADMHVPAGKPAPADKPALAGKRVPERMPPGLRWVTTAAWLAIPVAVAAAAAVAVYTVTAPPSTAQGSAAQGSAGNGSQAGLASNSDLDPGTELSGPAPDFTLTDQFGQPVSLRSYRGKVVILAFIDAECTTTCPLTTAAMVDAKAMLGAAGADLQLVGVNANPKATAVMDLQSYSELHGMLHQWHFLTGSLPELKSVWKSYSVGVEISQNLINHTSAVFVISPDGKLAKLYMSQQSYSSVGQMGQLLAQEASSLLPAHPAVRSHLSYAQIAGISPATAVTLPRAGGGTIRLGPGQARLYLFFATWDREITSLAGHLDALSEYESSAKANGLPGLTAVDEGSVEPTPAALRQFLTALPRPLPYPVAIDSTGRVADGYQVLGQPWFALVSPAGKILWSREVSTKGWLTPAELTRHVRAALAQLPA